MQNLSSIFSTKSASEQTTINNTTALRAIESSKSLPDSSIIAGYDAIISEATDAKKSFDDIISKVSESTGSDLTSYKYPTWNDAFNNWSDYVGDLMQFDSTMKDPDQLSSMVCDMNGTMGHDFVNMSKDDAISYLIELTGMQGNIQGTYSDVVNYFNKIQRLMSMMKVVDIKLEGKNWACFYASKTISEKLEIDNMFAEKSSMSKIDWANRSSELMHDIKI